MISKEHDNKLDPTLIDKYFGSKKSQIDHILGNYLMLSMRSFRTKLNVDRDQRKKEFADGLAQAQGLPNYGAVTDKVLADIQAKFEETDWEDEESLRELYNFINQVRV